MKDTEKIEKIKQILNEYIHDTDEKKDAYEYMESICDVVFETQNISIK